MLSSVNGRLSELGSSEETCWDLVEDREAASDLTAGWGPVLDSDVDEEPASDFPTSVGWQLVLRILVGGPILQY